MPMTFRTKLKLTASGVGHATKTLLTNPIKFVGNLIESAITPLADEELNRIQSLNVPEEHKFTYQRNWDYPVYKSLSQIRSEAGRKGGKVSKNKQNTITVKAK